MRHRRRRPGLVAVLAGALTVAAAPPVVAGPQPPPVPRPAASATADDAEVHTVTLVTGDRVRLTGGGGIADLVVIPGPGREDIGHRRYRQDGDLYVVPHDAAPLIAAGTLDERLFNVSRLIEAGYHDEARADVPVVVAYADGQWPARSRTLADGAATSVRPLAAVNGEAIRAAKDKATRYWSSVAPMLRPDGEIEHLWLDAPVTATSDGTVPQIGAPDAWEGGHTGEGVRVAVLDTGVDTEHPDLDDAVVEAQDFTGEGTTDDSNGHGTHVAGIIAGDGTASEGRYRGVAPDAELVVGRVLDGSGGGRESWILAGMEWAAQRAPVVNMSLGSNWPDDGTAPLSLAVDRLTEETGALFVVSSGNSGPSPGIGSPASANTALTVGAVDDDDELANFSSRGPRSGDNAIKPELTAPGVDVVAARAAGTQNGTPVGESYTSMSGTSMAAPHVAGAAALVAQAHEDWTADRLKAALVNSTAAHPDRTVYEQGAGRVDVARAVSQRVVAEPAVLNLGVAAWPHDDDQPLTRTVTYTNSGEQPVTLNLRTALRGPDGEAADDMLTVTPGEVTIPAGGQAEATVTVDTSAGDADGLYGGAVVAIGDDGSVVRTTLGVTRERESYDVSLTVLGPDGEALEDAWIRLVSLTEQSEYQPEFEAGAYRVRVPRDEYYLDVVRSELQADGEWAVTSVAEPVFVVDGPEDVVLDLREAVEPRVELADRDEARMGEAILEFDMRTRWGDTGSVSYFGDLEDVRVMPTSAEHENFSFTLETAHARPDGAGGFVGSPYQYQLRHVHSGGVPEDLLHRVADDDLATVHNAHAVGEPSMWAQHRIVQLELPAELTEYYTPGVPWKQSVWFMKPSEDGSMTMVGSLESTPRTFERGSTTRLRWGTAVHGPAFPYSDERASGGWAYRVEQGLAFSIPMYSDGAGHAGHAQVDAGLTELYRDGELVGTADSAGIANFEMPNAPASYRLHVRAEGGEFGRLSPVIDAEWTFRGEAAEPGGIVVLPLLGVHFGTDFGITDAPRAGEAVHLPVTVQRNGTPQEPDLRSLQVEVSFDSGSSWRPTTLHPYQGEQVITVTAPEGAKDVSLRVTAEDQDGNTLKQTILGAYPVR